jgi:DNA-binding NarL/FixJ family response regulator
VTGRLTIVVVDDDDLDAERIVRAIAAAGLNHPLHVVQDAHDALDLLRGPLAGVRCVVLLDLHMPRLDGFQFLRALRATAPPCRVPVVMLSSSDTADDLRTAYDLGVAGYLVKNVTNARLAENLRVLVDYWERMEIA